ncbi:MAG: helix-turn-helix domain-containing protein [Elusimicrobiota bacterium]|jgi:transcriptional regulator with XRE-family HTH domain|nr:helix-turn-helix domain-containing protein [Elusimicrobiota bacterium]
MTLGQKIKLLLKERAMKQIELAQNIKLKDSSAISQWIKGKTKPSSDNIKKLSEVFGKPLSFFEDDEEYVYNGMVMDKRADTQKTLEKLLSSFPIIRPVEVRSNISSETFDLFVYTQPEEFLPIMFEAKPASPFALKIEDTKACPWANKGEYAIFAPVPEGAQGKIVLAKHKGMHSIKKFFKGNDKENNTVFLEDKNKKRKKYLAEEVEIIGQLLAFYRKP